jgi:hypothetical protein
VHAGQKRFSNKGTVEKEKQQHKHKGKAKLMNGSTNSPKTGSETRCSGRECVFFPIKQT